MSNKELVLIARQGLELERLRNKVIDYEGAFQSIRGHIFSIGAPLNDNVLRFNSKQLMVFKRIVDEIDKVY